MREARDAKKQANLVKILTNFSLIHKFQTYEVKNLLNISHQTARNYIRILIKQQKIIKFNSGRRTYYRKV